jgi:tetratricopeptide (TPR) repeat protein
MNTATIGKFTKRTLVLACSLLLADAALAQRSGGNDPPPSNNTIDARTGETLQEAIDFINADQTTEARAKLGELDLARLSPYERSRVEQMLASLDMGDENYDSARAHLQAAIDSGGLNDQELSSSSYAIAQSWIAEEKWSEGATALEAWIRNAVTEVGSGPYYLLAVAYYSQDRYDEALPHARKAVELTNPPQESWLQMLYAILMQQENYQEALVVVKQMVTLFPDKKNYWMQLSNIYATLEDFANALAIMQFADYNGMITEDTEIRRLADMMMVQEMPFQAAEMLEAAGNANRVEKDMKYYENLANSWIASREYRKSLPVLGEAAKLADNGDTYVRIAEVNVQLSEWEAAATALRSALDKGGLRDESQAQLLMGMSLYYQDKFSEARPYLERARSGTNTRNTANGFLQLIESRQ